MKTSRQDIALRYIGEVKEFITMLAKNVSSNFENNGESILDNSGIASSIIKLIGQHAIDEYFQKSSEKKLENLGAKTYLKAALDCAESSIEKIKNEILIDTLDASTLLEKLDNINNETTSLQLYLIPNYNPAIQQVKKVYLQYLTSLNIDKNTKTAFIKNFNVNIETFVINAFGKDYDKHKEDIKAQWLNQNEELLLAEMIELKRVGLQENESLGYEDTFGQWCSIGTLDSNRLHEVHEKNQRSVTELLEEFFSSEKNDFFSDCITFIVADFGKGKSVFLKQYSSSLAERYISTNSGPIPVYFNLNKYHDKKYDHLKNRGIIDSFLRSEYKIDIEDEYFRKKEFIFLIDSLDESGDLNKVDEVINSVYKLNKNSPLDSPKHKIIIASRPIDKELSKSICNFKSKLDNNKHPQFISLYGFKPDQFDHWLKTSVLSKLNGRFEIQKKDSVTELLFSGWSTDNFSAYNSLLKNNVLDREELVKPLFAYILYQLLTNNINIPSNGRVGIYLSFLHYISSQAKFVSNSSEGIKDELCNRKVLHAISAIWCKQRSTGENAIISREHIKLSLIGSNAPDAQAIQQFNTIDELKFLSHSYFGDSEQNLHFQHQSFAEILLAEYFLKVFLNEALNDEPNINKTRELIFIGEPTIATMEFFSELVKILIAGVEDDEKNITPEIIRKRKLLLPVIGSLSAPIFREKLHNPALKAKIFKSKDILHTERDIIEKYWPITEEILENLNELASNILLQKNSIKLAQHVSMTSLFNNELVLIDNEKSCKREDIDKWLSICLGGLICYNRKNKQYFLEKNELAYCFFKLIQDSSSKSIPSWVTAISSDLFNHTNFRDGILNGLDIDGVDFSHSTFLNVEIKNSSLNVILENCVIERVNIQDSYLVSSFKGSSIINSSFNGTTMRSCDFSNLKSMKNISLLATSFWGVELPVTIQLKLKKEKSALSKNYKVVIGNSYFMNDDDVIETSEIIFHVNDESLGTFLESAINCGILDNNDISDNFEFMSESSLSEFVESVPESIKEFFTEVRNDPKYNNLELAFNSQTKATKKRKLYSKTKARSIRKVNNKEQ